MRIIKEKQSIEKLCGIRMTDGNLVADFFYITAYEYCIWINKHHNRIIVIIASWISLVTILTKPELIANFIGIISIEKSICELHLKKNFQYMFVFNNCHITNRLRLKLS